MLFIPSQVAGQFAVDMSSPYVNKAVPLALFRLPLLLSMLLSMKNLVIELTDFFQASLDAASHPL